MNFISQIEGLEFIEEIWLFGSRARGDNLERSDIDIAIVCPTADDKDWLQVMEIIDNADTLLKIDCIRFDKTRISDALYQNIMKDKKILYVKNTAEI